MIAVVEYTPETAHRILSDARERRARLYAPRALPEPPPEVVPEPVPEPKAKKAWVPVGSREAQPWREEEVAILREMVAADRSARAIAKRLHRTPTAVQIRARKLGLSATLIPRRDDVVKVQAASASVGGQARAIMVETAKSYGYPVDEILANCRNVGIVQARHHAMWLCARDTDLSYPTLGRAFGRDHTTILHAVRRVNAIMGANVRNAGLPR